MTQWPCKTKRALWKCPAGQNQKRNREETPCSQLPNDTEGNNQKTSKNTGSIEKHGTSSERIHQEVRDRRQGAARAGDPTTNRTTWHRRRVTEKVKDGPQRRHRETNRDSCAKKLGPPARGEPTCANMPIRTVTRTESKLTTRNRGVTRRKD